MNSLDFVINIVQKMGGKRNAADEVGKLHRELDQATSSLSKMEATQKRVGASAAALEKTNAALVKARSASDVAASKVAVLADRHRELSVRSNVSVNAMSALNAKLAQARTAASAAATAVSSLESKAAHARNSCAA